MCTFRDCQLHSLIVSLPFSVKKNKRENQDIISLTISLNCPKIHLDMFKFDKIVLLVISTDLFFHTSGQCLSLENLYSSCIHASTVDNIWLTGADVVWTTRDKHRGLETIHGVQWIWWCLPSNTGIHNKGLHALFPCAQVYKNSPSFMFNTCSD